MGRVPHVDNVTSLQFRQLQSYCIIHRIVVASVSIPTPIEVRNGQGMAAIALLRVLHLRCINYAVRSALIIVVL